jgi:hypothetical protein
MQPQVAAEVAKTFAEKHEMARPEATRNPAPPASEPGKPTSTGES